MGKFFFVNLLSLYLNLIFNILNEIIKVKKRETEVEIDGLVMKI